MEEVSSDSDLSNPKLGSYAGSGYNAFEINFTTVPTDTENVAEVSFIPNSDSILYKIKTVKFIDNTVVFGGYYCTSIAGDNTEAAHVGSYANVLLHNMSNTLYKVVGFS